MAGRDSGAVSANVTRPQWRDVGAKVMLGAKVLEQAAEMLQDVEHYPIWAIGSGSGVGVSWRVAWGGARWQEHACARART